MTRVFLPPLRQPPRFAAVFTDLGMPYVDGRRVAETIIPGSGKLTVNVDYVLSKPPRLRELRAVLSRVAQSTTLETGT